jgi:hypothetical protein
MTIHPFVLSLSKDVSKTRPLDTCFDKLSRNGFWVAGVMTKGE